MLLTLVRHGKTDWNESGRCQGISDVPLNGRGLRQAEMLALSLRNERIDRIYSSGLERAKKTAEKIAAYHSMDVHVRDDFREMDQGIFEGLEFSHIRKNYPDVLRQWRQEPETLRLPGGEETLGCVQRRAFSAVLDIESRFGSENVMVVSHNLTIITLLCKFAGASLKEFRNYMVDEASKSVVDIRKGKFTVISVNDVSHLEFSGGREPETA